MERAATTTFKHLARLLSENLSSCKCEMKSDAYLMYVRPILEYAACSWAPHTKCNIDKLESVQRRAARFVNGDYRYTSSVTEMINTLDGTACTAVEILSDYK